MSEVSVPPYSADQSRHTSISIPDGLNSLSDLLEQSFTKFADHPAFTCGDVSYTFAQMEQKSRALAAWLQHDSGLQPGDRVAIQLPNLIQFPIAAYAVLRAGMVVVNTNPMYTPTEMRHQFKNSGAKAVVILQEHLGKLAQIKAETDIIAVIETGYDDLSQGTTQDVTEGHLGFCQLLSQYTNATLTDRQSTLSDICLLQYTGGTTGVSKGAALHHRNMLANTLQLIDRFSAKCAEASEIYVCPLPVYHIYAFTVNLIVQASMGNHNILITNPRDMDSFIGAMQGVRFTGMAGINTLFVGLCQQPAFAKLDFSGLKLTISGGSTLTSATAELWQKVTGCTITEAYGLSECSPVLTFNIPGQEEIGSVGLPVIDTEIQFWDDKDQPVADGEEGQLVARGPQVMQGYWEMPEESQKVLTPDGWFKTGDVGKRLPSGVVKIVDRLKDMILVSGFNVYPNQVEDVLTQHPHILEAAVVGEPDETTGERVCAYITVTEAVETEAVVDFCREQLTGYKVPKKVTILDELPKSTVGKILRRELRNA